MAIIAAQDKSLLVPCSWSILTLPQKKLRDSSAVISQHEQGETERFFHVLLALRLYINIFPENF
jgi:hypothetical protein